MFGFNLLRSKAAPPPEHPEMIPTPDTRNPATDTRNPATGNLFALVDCNNFYVSCEPVFNPGLRGRPAVVLSNNDGFVISRSQEAKALGIEMAAPHFVSGAQIIEDYIE